MHAPNSSAVPFTPKSTNRLLSVLPDDDYLRISQQLATMPVAARQLLHRQGHEIVDVYFPEGGALSLTKSTRDGQAAEVATIGNEGMFGAGVFFGDHVSPGDVLVQVPEGYVRKMPACAFVAEMARRGAFYNVVIRYSQALTMQIMQMTVCNGLHTAVARSCRWLLMISDRSRHDEFPLTHDWLAGALGVRRPTATLVMAHLRSKEVIQYRRGRVRIANRQQLEQSACECYESVKQNFRRLLPEIARPPTRWEQFTAVEPHVIGGKADERPRRQRHGAHKLSGDANPRREC